MSMFLTRVELHQASAADYDKLHQNMQQVGFHRVIKGNDNKTYELPPAEYVAESSHGIASVQQAAETAAARSKSGTHGVVTVQAANILWSGLKVFNPAAAWR